MHLFAISDAAVLVGVTSRPHPPSRTFWEPCGVQKLEECLLYGHTEQARDILLCRTECSGQAARGLWLHRCLAGQGAP